MREKPFSFYDKDLQKQQEKKAQIESQNEKIAVKPFKAKEVPIDTAIDKFKQMEIEERKKKEELKEKLKETQ
jgi:Uncharacterised protein family UPF0564